MALKIRLHEMNVDGENDPIPEEQIWKGITKAAYKYRLDTHYSGHDYGWVGYVIDAMEKNGVREVLDNTDKYFPEIADRINAQYIALTHVGDMRLFKDVATELFRNAKSVMSQVLRGLKKEKIEYKPQPTYPRTPVSYYENRQYMTGTSYTTAIFYDDPNDSADYARVSIAWEDSYPSIAGNDQPTEIRATLPLQVLVKNEYGKPKYISVPLILNTHCGTIEAPKGYNSFKETFKLLGGMELYNVADGYKIFCRMGDYRPKDETTPQGFVDYVKSQVAKYNE